MSFLFRFHDIIGGIHVPVDDGVDKLNRKYTLLVFLFLALPIFTKQYIGDPIECFAPVYFAEHQSRYINSYCWTQSTYYMVPVGDPEDDGDQQEPPDRIMPDEVDYFIGFETVTHIGNERLRRVRVSYYQWAPLILLVQGLCFYIPFLIWNSCANNAGVKLRRLLKKASDIASLPPGCQQREALLAEFVDQFHTLVTGEAGWCADLQCGGGGGAGNVSSPSSSIASSQASSALAMGNGGHHAPAGSAGGQRGTATLSRHQGQGGNANANTNNNNNNNNNNNDDDNGGGGRGRSHHSSSNKSSGGCCLVGIPIIGSLLACCLKPCSSFGLVGPSKYLCLLYLAVKSAYVFNVGLQFFLLGQFLGRGYLKHGLELINRLIINGDWWASPRFPLSTLCQVRADMSGGLRSYTCQCVLPINVFNEKIFSVVWFYMAFLMPLNVLSLLFWIYRTFETNRLSYIRLCLWRTRLVELNQIHRTVRRLSQSYLGWDGVFLLRLIEHNHGSIMATLIMSRLWEFYANQMKLQEDQNQLALANNAQHTLSNTTTAITNQQHILAASAAAAAAAAAAANHHGPPQIGAGPGAGIGGHSQQQQQQHHHAHAGHSHGPPLMPSTGGGGQLHHPHAQPLQPLQPQQQQQFAHSHGPHAHATPHGFTGGQVQVGGGGHGPHVHHSGQISGQPGHHPLHAAPAHAHHHATGPPPHLAGPFAASATSNLLAQLQHQHAAGQQQQQQQLASSAGQSHGSGALNAVSQHQQSQQAASGNVAAAVAALAAATAAANSHTTNQSAPGQVVVTSSTQASATTTTSTSGITTTNSSNTNNTSSSLAASQQQQQQQQQTGAQQAQSMHPIHSALHSLMQSSSSSASPATLASSQHPAIQATGAGGGQATTAFITAPQVTAATAAASSTSGPPLPPPPPAHVVAAVAAAASNSSGPLTASVVNPVGAGPSSGGAGQVAPGMARTGASVAGLRAATGQPPTNPILFNLKSSSGIQVAAAQSSVASAANVQQQQQQTTRYSPHTIKRT